MFLATLLPLPVTGTDTGLSYLINNLGQHWNLGFPALEAETVKFSSLPPMVSVETMFLFSLCFGLFCPPLGRETRRSLFCFPPGIALSLFPVEPRQWFRYLSAYITRHLASVKTVLGLINSCLCTVKSILLYECETWRTTQTMQQKIQTFFNTCLRRIYTIQWQKIWNEDLWERGEQEPVAKQILRRKWGWVGHTLRKLAASTTRQALTLNPPGKRKRGRPRNSLRRDTDAENRVRWRGVVDGRCSTGSDGQK